MIHSELLTALSGDNGALAKAVMLLAISQGLKPAAAWRNSVPRESFNREHAIMNCIMWPDIGWIKGIKSKETLSV